MDGRDIFYLVLAGFVVVFIGIQIYMIGKSDGLHEAWKRQQEQNRHQ